MKPRRTPLCFFSNASRYSLRSAITAVMSTSLKVVSMAAVFCASFSRAAMVRRRRVMRTRSSRGSASRARLRNRAAARHGSGTVQERQHVALGDASVLAGAGADPLGLQVLFLDQLGSRRQRRMRGDIGRRRRGTSHRTARRSRRIHASLRHARPGAAQVLGRAASAPLPASPLLPAAAAARHPAFQAMHQQAPRCPPAH